MKMDSDRESRETRDSDGEPSSMWKSKDPSASCSFSFSFSSDSLLKMAVNEGAVGFNFGVAGRWDEEGRVPMGACRGRLCLSKEES